MGLLSVVLWTIGILVGLVIIIKLLSPQGENFKEAVLRIVGCRKQRL